MLGFEYRSEVSFGSWPLVHVCMGVDSITMRPKVARGVIAIGNVAVGGVAVAGVACGLISVGGLSVGLLFALGGAALGLGLSVGGLAIGSVAFGGAAIGFLRDWRWRVWAGHHPPPALRSGRRRLRGQWLGSSVLPPNCR